MYPRRQDLAVGRSRPGRSAWLPILLASATALAAMAFYNHRRAREGEAAFPPMGRFITVDGVRLHYVEQGQGQPVVFLHGNGAMIQDFDYSRVLGLAAQRYRVIAFDRPGYGYSERPRNRLWTPSDQAELMQKAFRQLGIEQPIVVGHSWGALVTMALATGHPLEIRGIVLLSGYFFPTLRKDVLLLSLLALPGLGDLLRHTILPIAGRVLAPRLLRKLFAPAPVPASFATYPIELTVRPSQLRASAEEYAVMTPTAALLARRYCEVALPTVIIAGADDAIVDINDHSLRLHHQIRESSMVALPGQGHMPHHASPDRVVAAIDCLAGKAA